MALSPEDIAMLKEAGLVDEAAEARYEVLKARGAARAARQQAVRAARLRAVAQTRETQLRARIDKAIREVLARPEFAESVADLTSAAAPAPVPLPVPDKPLHEMTAEEWDARRRTFWQAAMPDHTRALTISDLLGRPSGGDEA
ncbi:hypothetical protein ACH47C_26905 [Streptomyces rishiriensis]|uniref:hypothetical protein n=1 Tax=Streptomyces rishiriensis TaxID=68264 RepID=UPI0033DC8AC4